MPVGGFRARSPIFTVKEPNKQFFMGTKCLGKFRSLQGQFMGLDTFSPNSRQ